MQGDSSAAPLIYWFRNDLRLRDNPAWTKACATGQPILAITLEPLLGDRESAWGDLHVGAPRLAWWRANVGALQGELAALGVELIVMQASIKQVMETLVAEAGVSTLYCQEIAAPYEQAEVSALEDMGVTVNALWGCTLFDAKSLPFEVPQIPSIFSQFRREIEHAGVRVPLPLPAPAGAKGYRIPERLTDSLSVWVSASQNVPFAWDRRTAFSWQDTASASYGVRPGHTGGIEYLSDYFSSPRVAQYKATRNGLVGMAYSSKWSPWLALGALSAREIVEALRRYENLHGANEGSYWLWFELLWREYFRWLHIQYGSALYRRRGLARIARFVAATKHQRAFAHWTQGRTGVPLVDAGMRELACSGYSSNRMRQILASYWIYDLGGDWRAGAAWFESQLLDYDVYSNQGNWLYIAGVGTDPRGGRQFNIQKQQAEHDPEGVYCCLWGSGV
jgi:deoxyribodipyrimidine photo-lyase